MPGRLSEVYGAVVISKYLISFFTHFGVGTSEVSNNNSNNCNNIAVCEFLFKNVN